MTLCLLPGIAIVAPMPLRRPWSGPRALLAAGLLLAAVPAGAKTSVNRLLRELSATQGDAQLRVIRALGRSGRSKAAAPLLALFDVRQDSPRRSAAIAEALGKLGARGAAEPLTGAWDYLTGLRQQGELPAQIAVLRRAVVEALGGVGGEAAGRTLLEALSDPDPAVAQGAARGLGLLRERRAAGALSELSSRGGNLGQAACEALGRIGGEQVVPALQRGLRLEPAQAASAAYGLALMGRKEGRRRLEELLAAPSASGPSGVLAAYYLAKLDRSAGLDFLVRRLESGEEALSLPAAEALGKCGNPRAAAPLAEALGRAGPALRLVIARGLGELGGPRAALSLKALRDDPDPGVRGAAAIALAELGED